MTPELIKQWADKAGFYDTSLDQWVVPCSDILYEFAALVAAHQREMDAKVCDEIERIAQEHGERGSASACAAAIRGKQS